MNDLKIPRFAKLWVISFVFATVFYCVLGFVQFMADRNLPEERFSVEDLELVALVPKVGDGSYSATDADPCIIIDGERKVKKITFFADYYVEAGEVVSFYKTDNNQDYSMRKCAIASQIDGGYTFDYHSKKVSNIRIDPTSVGGNKIFFGDIVINGNITMGDYISFSPFTVFALFVAACFISCSTEYLLRLFNKN